MNDKLARILGQLIPYIIAGIAIISVLGLLILFYYVVVWGIVTGLILWLVAFIKERFFKQHRAMQPRKGRIINHDRNRDT